MLRAGALSHAAIPSRHPSQPVAPPGGGGGRAFVGVVLLLKWWFGQAPTEEPRREILPTSLKMLIYQKEDERKGKTDLTESLMAEKGSCVRMKSGRPPLATKLFERGAIKV